jgi:hypothetical protein
MIFEVQIGLDALHGFAPQLEFGVGVMKNVSSDWGVGVRASANIGGDNGGLALRVRGRRWIDNDVSVEAEAGVLRANARWGGLTTGARATWRDQASLFLRHDVVPVRASEPTRRLIVGGAGAGSTPAAVADGLLLLFGIAFASNPLGIAL